jgi:hypothetical protein
MLALVGNIDGRVQQLHGPVNRRHGALVHVGHFGQAGQGPQQALNNVPLPDVRPAELPARFRSLTTPGFAHWIDDEVPSSGPAIRLNGSILNTSS